MSQVLKIVLICALVVILGAVFCGCNKNNPTGKTTPFDTQGSGSWEDLISNSGALLDKIPQGTALSGTWTGALVITDYKFAPIKKAQTGDQFGAMSQDMQEGCQEMVAALKDNAIPIQFQLTIGADGKGQMIMKSTDGEKQDPIPVEYANGKLTVLVPANESMPDAKFKMDAEVAGMTDKYRNTLKERAAKQKTQVEPLNAKLKAKQASLNTASADQKAKIQQDIETLQKEIQFVQVGADYMNMIADSKATIRLSGNWEQTSTKDSTFIKGIWTAVNADLAVPKN